MRGEVEARVNARSGCFTPAARRISRGGVVQGTALGGGGVAIGSGEGSMAV